jgi:hypothetical protein
MLTPTAQVLYASAHVMLKHGGRNAPLCWFYDLDCLLRFYAERMDWDLLLAQAATFEWGSALDAALSQTYVYFDTPIPAPVRDNLSKSSDRHRNLVARTQTQPQPATRIIEEYQNLLALKWYGRIIVALALVAPSPAYMRWRYKFQSAWATPIYYLIRWAGIFKDAIRTLIVFFSARGKT